MKFSVYAGFQLQDMPHHKILIDDLLSRIFKESSMVLVALESWTGTHLKYMIGGTHPSINYIQSLGGGNQEFAFFF